MAKTNRGKALRHLPSNARGTCPICKRTRVKLLYDFTLADENTIKVCKNCKDKDAQEVAIKSIEELTDAEKQHQKLVQ